MTQRIYIVRNKAHQGERSRLVLAANPAQAMRHVSNDLFDVKSASAMDVANLMASGVTVEGTSQPEQESLGLA